MQPLLTFETNGHSLHIHAPVTPATPAAPETSAPGTGRFEISALALSAEKIAPGGALTLSAQIRGSGIAYIYTELLLRDPDSGQCCGPLVREHVLSARSAETGGLTRPVWEPDMALSIRITPALRLLTDGVEAAFACLIPQAYGQPGYQLDGLFTRAGGGDAQRARLKLGSSGELTSALLYKQRGARSTPQSLSLAPGDQFSPFVQILAQPAGQPARGTSNSLTEREASLRWLETAPLPGPHLLGLLIEDLDGNQARQYVPFTIEPSFRDE